MGISYSPEDILNDLPEDIDLKEDISMNLLDIKIDKYFFSISLIIIFTLLIMQYLF